jgi:methionine-rich copper-binding protein CopC
MKSFVQIFFIALAALFVISVASSCANMVPPTGGARDSLPPVLVNSTPNDSAKNVTPKKIVLTFNEYVELTDVSSNLIVSPTPFNAPFVESKLKTVTVKLKDSLEANTTYSINFGKSIKDVNEGNVMKEFTYVFSTGNSIDSNTITGKVLLAETGKTDSTLLVVLHKNLNDTAVVKLRPRYYTKLNGDGSFTFKNLPAQNFNVFVLPNDYTKRYDDSSKLFGFLNTAVLASKETKPVTIYTYAEAKRKETTPASTANNQNNNSNKSEDKRLKYTTNLLGNMQDVLGKFQITFNRKIVKFDSSKFILCDTNYKPISNYQFILDSSKTKLTLQNKWVADNAYRLLILKDAATDSVGIALTKNDTLKFATKKEGEYGSVKIEFKNLDLTQNPVLQIMKGSDIFESIVITQKEFYRQLFQPGDYEMRILFDANKNGVWDAGNYKKKIQPEVVRAFTQKLSIRNNWDNEATISF